MTKQIDFFYININTILREPIRSSVGNQTGSLASIGKGLNVEGGGGAVGGDCQI